MSSYTVLLVCILACFFLNTASASTYGRADLRGLGLAGLVGLNDGIYGPGIGAAYGGRGVGNVGIAGELPVRGTTAVAAQVPIIGAVEYAGCVPAAGVVTIQGSRAGGCGCRRY